MLNSDSITFGVLYRYQTEAQIRVLCLIEMLNSDSITFGVLYRYQTEAQIRVLCLIGLLLRPGIATHFSRAQQLCSQYSVCYKFSGSFCNDQLHVEIARGILLVF